MSSSILRGRYLICDANRVIPRGALYQERGKIVEVGDYQDLAARYRPDDELGSDDFLVMPGLVDSHYHGRGLTTFQLGVAGDSLEMRMLASRASPVVDPYLDTLYAAIRLIECGVTTVFHSNTSRGAAQYEFRLREALRAYLDLGMRVAFAVDIRDRYSFVYEDDSTFAQSLPEEMRERMRRLELVTSGVGQDRFLAIFDSLQEEFGGSPRVRLVAAPHSPQCCSPELLRAVRRKTEQWGTGLQMHDLETPYQRAYGWRRHGMSLIEYLRDLDMLGPEVSVAHAVWASEKDLDLLAATGTSVAHNPSCNLILKSGIAPVLPMLDRGINVGLGTDSDTLNDDEDMIQEMRLCAKLHRQPGIGSRSITAREVFRMATASGARITGFGESLGSLEPGREADAVLLRIDRLLDPYLDPSTDMVSALLQRARSQDVDTVVVAGELVLQGRKPLRVDRAEIVARLKQSVARSLASSAAETEEKLHLVRDLLPYVASFYEGWLPDVRSQHYLFNSRE